MPKNSTRYSYVCVVCSAPGTSGYPQTICCRGCKTAARSAYQRKRIGSVAIGTEFRCKHCDKPFAKTHKRQRYCLPCSALSTANKLPHVVEWNRNYQREYQKRRRHESAAAAINARMSAGIKNSLRDTKNGRSWESLVGYTISELMVHLERQFTPGMDWKNRGRWHIDHIVPLDSFKFDSAEHPDFRAAWAITNLRPLWALENISKSNSRNHLL